MLRLIRRETVVSEFAQARGMSVLFPFRVPSETMQLVRTYRNDEICAFSPHLEKTLIGIRTTPDGCFLVAKFKWRKNITGGCVPRRPCFCCGDRPDALAFCPVHVLWPAIRERVPPGQPLFTTVNSRNFNRITRAVLTRLRITASKRYSSHGFRRGAAQELKEVGSPWAVVATAGLWRPPAFRGNVDLTAEVEQGVRSLFPVDSDSESDAEAV